jgi:hypothetical protein
VCVCVCVCEGGVLNYSPRQNNKVDQTKENEMGRACNMH